MSTDKEIVVFELITGRFVFGEKDTDNSTHNYISIVSPITVVDVMTQQGPQQAPVPYGHSLYEMNPTEKESLIFNYKDILTGPRVAPEKLKEIWIKMTSIVQSVENKIEIAR